MDALSITTGVVALAGAVYKASSEARSIIDEVELTQGALRGVERALGLDPDAIVRYELNDVFGTAVKGCRATLACIKTEFEVLFGRSDWKSRFMMLWKEEDMEKLLSRLSRKRDSIVLLAHVLSLHSMQEIRSQIAQNRPTLELARQDIYALIPNYPGCRGTILDSIDTKTTDSILEDRDSVLSVTEFDFDFELINTKAYRRVLERAQEMTKDRDCIVIPQAENERVDQEEDFVDLTCQPETPPGSIIIRVKERARAEMARIRIVGLEGPPGLLAEPILKHNDETERDALSK
ncbi:hypothetical protein HJFPF1_10528 [Paramyrothecium foliicola]|nr:hypothetical protein HJFPF1_10528 [Paramyrothecium foliicola]